MTEYQYQLISDTQIAISVVKDRNNGIEGNDDSAVCQMCDFSSGFLGLAAKRQCTTLNNGCPALLSKKTNENVVDAVANSACSPKPKPKLTFMFARKEK